MIEESYTRLQQGSSIIAFIIVLRSLDLSLCPLFFLPAINSIPFPSFPPSPPMDPRSFNVMSLFARPGTPTQQAHGSPKQVSPTASYREPAPASPPKSLDSLFSNLSQTNLTAVSSSDQTPPASANLNNPFRTGGNPPVPNPQQSNSGPGTPVSSVTVGSSNGSSGAANTNLLPADRQSALLSLIGSTMGPNSSGAAQAAQPVSSHHAQQQPLIPDLPPSPSHEQQLAQHRQMPLTSESQGKALLEQLMSG